MHSETAIIAPVFALVAWSMVMWVWMYATRIPAIRAAKMELDSNAPRGQQMSMLPAKVQWKADNYTHLMEQPTVFYALTISLAVIGKGSGINVYLAWAYVVLRILHSLVQASVNHILCRFVIFVLSNVPLCWLAVNGILSFV